MTAKKFIIKSVIKTLIFAIVSTVVMTLLESPVITNEIAMGQMENSNSLFILMEIYNKIRPFITVIYGCIAMLFAGSIAYDVYKFIKSKKENS